MKNSPLISVVITFYNPPEDFLREAIESVLGQTYPNVEILLVDDGSGAESRAVALKYAAGYPERVRLLAHPDQKNRGISASRNLGIQHARGGYVSFLDADDIWLPDKLQEQADRLEAHPEADWLYGNTLYWYSWSGREPDRKRDFTPQLGVPVDQVIQPPALLPWFLSGKAAVPCTCSLLVRREAFETFGGFEERFTGMYEDQVFYAKMSLSAAVYVSGLCLEQYRQHLESISARTARLDKNRAARRIFLDWLTTYLAQNGIRHPEVWRAVRREAWLNRESGWLGSAKSGRRVKKWMLKLEETLLPAGLRRWLWARDMKKG